jgi:immune inhibitor A
MAGLYAEYLRIGKPQGLTFRQYLAVIGYTNPADEYVGMDDGALFRRAAGLELIRIPSQPVRGPLRVKVLLVDFPDRPGTLPASHYERLLFSKGTLPTGSLRDFYAEASLGKVDVTGSVHGWLRMPQTYSFYTNGQSGTVWSAYPRNAPRMAEDAVHAALQAGVAFEPELDILGQGIVAALFIVHSGLGAEGLAPSLRGAHIWSHKWQLRNPVDVGNGLTATLYLTVPNDAKTGVCCHELGHLAFQWEDFYDPNYDEDGSEWDGAGRWDLMAGGSYNGGGSRPAHPAGLHKTQHGWIQVQEVRASARVTLDPFTPAAASVAKVVGPRYRPGQYLILENRARAGFDADLPGEGLLVWRVDESRDQLAPQRPALLLVQADGRHDLERPDDWNEGDAGDPFPGSAGRTSLDDQGDVSTSFPESDSSGVVLRNIQRDPASGSVTLDVEIAGAGVQPPAGEGGTVSGEARPEAAIPDDDPAGVESGIVLQGAGSVQRIAVEVAVEHTYVGDLRVELVAPSGLVAVLHDREGGPADDLRATYRSSEVPALAALAGTPVAGAWRLRVTDLAAADRGTLMAWRLAVTPRTGDGAVRERRSPGAAIPDDDPAGVASVIAVSRAGVARSIKVGVDVTHPYVGDLRVELIGPQGERALLHNRAGGPTDNLKETYDSAQRAALAPLIGKPVRGDWTLRVADLAGRDTGTFHEWTLEIQVASAPEVVEAAAEPNLAIPDNSAAGAGSSVAVGPSGTAQSLQLRASIVHPYIGDLRVELIAPSGARAVLHDRTGGRTRDLNLDLESGSSAALGSLVGQPIKGVWLLRVSDLEAQDTGRLARWSLRIAHVP